MLCKMCHNHYDRNPDTNQKIRDGKRYTMIPVIAEKDGKKQRFESLISASKALGLHPWSIRQCAMGNYKQSQGYKFYVDDGS